MTEELQHHAMGPSSSDKWITCAGAYQAEQGLPDSVSSYAEEGTAAHTLAQWTLEDRKINCRDFLGDHLYNGSDGEDYYATEEMCDYVQEYVDYVRALFKQNRGSKLYVEVKVSIDRIWPGNFGTADVVIITGTTIHVIDFKYGAGIQVNARKNNQGLCYAVGAYDEFNDKRDKKLENVVIHIVQPRKDHIDTYELTVEELNQWADMAYHAYLETQKENPKRTASKKGCQWCKAKGDGCKEYAGMAMSTIIDDFDEYNDVDEAIKEGELVDTNNLSLEAMVKISMISTSIKGLLESVESMLTVRALAGEKINGHKVIRGPGGRSYIDKDAAFKSFTTSFNKDLVAPRTLKTPPQLEKVRDKYGAKLDLSRHFEEHVQKSEGNLLLRLETARGKAIEIAPAEEDYADYDDVDDDW